MDACKKYSEYAALKSKFDKYAAQIRSLPEPSANTNDPNAVTTPLPADTGTTGNTGDAGSKGQKVRRGDMETNQDNKKIRQLLLRKKQPHQEEQSVGLLKRIFRCFFDAEERQGEEVALRDLTKRRESKLVWKGWTMVSITLSDTHTGVWIFLYACDRISQKIHHHRKNHLQWHMSFIVC